MNQVMESVLTVCVALVAAELLRRFCPEDQMVRFVSGLVALGLLLSLVGAATGLELDLPLSAAQGQRQQSFFCREGKRQPGAGHLLGIQRVKKEEHGQPPLGRAGKKVQRVAHALAQLHGHSLLPVTICTPQAAVFHSSGLRNIPPYHTELHQISQGNKKNRFALVPCVRA